MRRVLAQRRRPASLLTVAPTWTVLSVGAWADDVDLGREVYDDFCVLNGKSLAMPAWRDKISDDDVNLLWAYVRSGG
jgi:hypothetical protein